MIYIIHGENIPQTREKITSLQNKHGIEQKTEVELTDTTPIQLKELLSARGMFDSGVFVCANVDGLHYTKYQSYVDEIKKIPESSVLVLFSGKELSASNAFIKNAAALKAVTYFVNPLISSNVFSFLDRLFSKNRTETYVELKKLSEDGQDNFYIFSMILYGLRNTIHAKLNSSLFAKSAPFVKSKASAQSKNFSQSELEKLFESMYKIDKDVKTGNISTEIFVPLAIEKVLEKSNT